MKTTNFTFKQVSLLFLLVIFSISLFSQTYKDNTAVPCTLAVKEQVLIKHFQIIPNPVINSFQINCNDVNINLPFDYTISDLSGKEIIKGSYIKNESIDISFLKRGMYIFKATDKEKRIYMYKLLKQ